MKKVAIVARAGTSVLAPFRDPEWEIWGLPWVIYPRLDVAFELHSQRIVDEETTPFFRDEQWLTVFEERYPHAKIYCAPSRVWRFKNAVEFPLEEVSKALPIPALENTVCYQIALAIKEGREEIGLWGVHMYAGPEAEVALWAIAYLVGLAQGRGIKVTIAPGSPLFMSHYVEGRYGVSNETRRRFVTDAGLREYPLNLAKSSHSN